MEVKLERNYLESSCFNINKLYDVEELYFRKLVIFDSFFSKLKI